MLSTHLRNLFLSALVVGSFVLGACAEEEEDPDYAAANVAACQNWLDTLEGLECWDAAYDPMIDCQATYGGTSTCDISEYFDCVSASYTCENGAVSYDATAFTACADLANCG